LTAQLNHTISIQEYDNSALEELLDVGLSLQKSFFVPLLAAGGVVFLIGTIAVAQLKRNIKTNKSGDAMERRRSYKSYAIAFIWLSVAISLASTLGVVVGTGVLQYAVNAINGSSITFQAGSTLQVLQWLIFSFSALFATGIAIMFHRLSGGLGGISDDFGDSGLSFPPLPPPPPPPPLGF
jgi:hypothetical protein